MFMNKIRKVSLCIAVILLYSAFYFPYLFQGQIIGKGDAQSLHYPGIYYLKESLLNHRFPFYTERIFSGFPIYENSEFAYLNPIRVLLAFLLQPTTVLKVEHFLIYLAGSLGMYLLAKKLKFSDFSFIVAHIIYFFSIQVTARFAHTNIIYVYFLLPLAIYTIEQFAQTQHKKWALFNAIITSVGIYYGNYNAVAIVLLAEFFYALTRLPLIQNIKPYLKYFAIFVLSAITFCAPVIITSGFAYFNSYRSSIGIPFSQGSITVPFLVSNLVFPFPFGYLKNYIASDIKSFWLFHENTVYFGFSTLILTIYAFVQSKKSHLKNFFYINAALFLILATLDYTPFGTLFNFPPFNIFRYWIRYEIILHFAAGLLIAKFLSEQSKIKIKEMLINVSYLIPFGLFLVVVFIGNIHKYTTTAVLDYFKTVPIKLLPYFNEWATITAIFGISFSVYLLTKKKAFLYFSCCIVICDVLFFSNLAWKTNMQQRSDLIKPDLAIIAGTLANQRVLYLDTDIKGNIPLYYPSWNLFGYAVSFEPETYINHLALYDLNTRRFKGAGTEVMQQLGVSYLINPDNTITKTSIDTDKLDLIKNNIEGEYLIKEEGRFILKLNLTEKKTIETLIRNYHGWEILVDGNKTNFVSDSKDVYLRFNLEQGQHTVELKYFPINLVYGLAVSGFIGLLTMFIYKKVG